MLEKAFNDVYTKFKLHFYQNVFQRFATREATLTTVVLETSEICIRPTFPSGNCTNAPKFVIPVTSPSTIAPTSSDIKRIIPLKKSLYSKYYTLLLKSVSTALYKYMKKDKK